MSTRPDEAAFHRLRGEPMQDPLPQQVQLGSPIAQALDQLHATDLALTLTSAPGHGQGQLDCFIVLTKALGQCLEGLHPRLDGFLEPGIKRLDIMFCKDPLEALLEVVTLGQSRIGL